MFRLLAVLCLSVALVWPLLVDAGEAPQDLTVCIDAGQFARTVFGEDCRLLHPRCSPCGLQYVVVRKDVTIGALGVGVFADADTAEAVLEERLTGLPVGFDVDLRGEVGDRIVVYGERDLLFRRGNVVVSLGLRDGDAWRAAQEIDGLLLRGAPGVSRGAAVLVPRILRVEVPDAVRVGATAAIKVCVGVPAGANGDRMAFAEWPGAETWRLVPSALPGEVELTQTFSYSAPTDPQQTGRRDFRICYVSAGCVAVPEKVSIQVVAP